MRALTDPDRDVRQQAAIDVGTSRHPDAAPVLVACLWTEEDFFVRETLVWAVAHVADAASPLLLAALTEADASLRVRALHALSKIADPATAGPVAALVADPVPDVAAKARWALTRIAGPGAAPALVALLGSGDSTARNGLTRDLAELGAAAVPTLVEALTGADTAARGHAAEVLGFIGPDARDATADLANALRDDAQGVRLAAAMALHDVGGPQAVEALAAHTDDPDPRLAAIARRALTRA